MKGKIKPATQKTNSLSFFEFIRSAIRGQESLTEERYMADEFRESEDDLVRTWSAEMLDSIFRIANEKRLPDNMVLNGIGMTINYINGSKVSVNFNFGLSKGGK